MYRNKTDFCQIKISNLKKNCPWYEKYATNIYVSLLWHLGVYKDFWKIRLQF